MTNQKISVIIPVYNVEKYLSKCLDSVINQTYKNLEIIIIDDGSKDNSGKICDEYAQKDARIICRHQANKGVSATRNFGIELTSGDYYHFLDSDDYLELNAYEYMLQKLDETKAEAISFEYFITYPDHEIQHGYPKERYGIKDKYGTIQEHLVKGCSFLCTKLLPAYCVKDLRIREDIYRDEDTLFGWQALRQLNRVYFSDYALLHYVQSEESACRGVFRKSQLSCVKVVPLVEDFLKNEFPSLLNLWRCRFLHLLITIYCDMYLDKVDYKKDMKNFYTEYKMMYNKIPFKYKINSLRDMLKFNFFYLSPNLFCLFHKKIHNL